MCDITDKTTRKRTGWKILAIKDGKFYSTFTGQEITKGQVPKAPEKANRLNSIWSSELLTSNFKDLPFYNLLFEGKTALFERLSDCKNEYAQLKAWGSTLEGFKPVIVKITFNNITYTGEYSNCPIIASDIIKSIEIVKE